MINKYLSSFEYNNCNNLENAWRNDYINTKNKLKNQIIYHLLIFKLRNKNESI